MKNNFTDNQRNAIFDDGGTILVSAAAGSGKTAVLTERVIQKIVTGKTSSDRILMVTFTKASSEEMKQRIKNKISKLVLENKDNEFLKEQQVLIEKANIDTISSFCINLIRENFINTNLSPDFLVADESVKEIIVSETINDVIKENMLQKNDEFISLVKAMGVKRDYNNIAKVISKTLTFMETIPYKNKYINETLSLYDVENIEYSVWVKILIDKTKNDIDFCVNIMNTAINMLNKDEDTKEKFLVFFKEEYNMYESVLKACNENNYSKVLREVDRGSFNKFPAVRKGYDIDIKNAIQKIRDTAKGVFLNLKDKYYLYNEDEIKEQIYRTKKHAKTLLNLCVYIDDLITKKLEDKNLITFSKAEELVLKMLTDENGKKTGFAYEVSKRYDYIFIDEYQDNNNIQDEIFKKISNDYKNLFMVGDIKQSIYGFRKANPNIFREKSNSFYNYNNKDYPAIITLSNNFRSKKCVTEFINYIFTQIMSEKIGGLIYDNNHKLISSNTSFIECNDSVDLSIINGKYDKEVEANVIAKKIKSMIDSKYKVNDNGELREVRYSDFAILLRSSKNYASIYKKVLEDNGISTSMGDEYNILEKKEIMTLISILRVINNPTDNIAMSSTMLSFIYRFTSEDLIKVRYKDIKKSLYYNLSNSDNEKYQDFINEIKYFRKMSLIYTVGDLLNLIVETTNCDKLVNFIDNTGVRSNNIHLFCEFCYNFQKMGNATLSGFLNYIDNMYSEDIILKNSINDSTDNDAVNIMTIHKSKGLEFNFVIVAGLSKTFNKDYTRSLVNVKEDIGINFVFNNEDYKKEKTLPYIIGCLKETETNISEEMRVLYVALTRAKEKIILCLFDKDIQNVSGDIYNLTDKTKINNIVVYNKSCYAHWLILSLLRSGILNIENINETLINKNFKVDIDYYDEFYNDNNEIIEVNDNNDYAVNEHILNVLKERTKLEYRHKDGINLPTKLSVSEISKSGQIYLSRPKFLQKNGLNQKEIGNAIHKFMQFCNYKNASENVKKEVERMVQCSFLSENEAKVIDYNKITKFFNSNLGQEVLHSENVFREYKIMTYVYPYEIYSNYSTDFKEKILVQGIADCVIINDYTITLVDYKTDKVKNEEELIKRYSAQIDLYSKALKNSIKKDVEKKIIYSFYLDKEIYL